MIFNQTLPAQSKLRDVSEEFWAVNSDVRVSLICAVVDEALNIVHVYAELVDLENFAPFYVPIQYAVDIADYVGEMMMCLLADGSTFDAAYWDNTAGNFALDEVYTTFNSTVRLFASWRYVEE